MDLRGKTDGEQIIFQECSQKKAPQHNANSAIHTHQFQKTHHTPQSPQLDFMVIGVQYNGKEEFLAFDATNEIQDVVARALSHFKGMRFRWDDVDFDYIAKSGPAKLNMKNELRFYRHIIRGHGNRIQIEKRVKWYEVHDTIKENLTPMEIDELIGTLIITKASMELAEEQELKDYANFLAELVSKPAKVSKIE